jgi:cellulose synthase/poly-beta-1,6-N-acetylglucosamine synthase-like glycosyltransferase
MILKEMGWAGFDGMMALITMIASCGGPNIFIIMLSSISHDPDNLIEPMVAEIIFWSYALSLVTATAWTTLATSVALNW